MCGDRKPTEPSTRESSSMMSHIRHSHPARHTLPEKHAGQSQLGKLGWIRRGNAEPRPLHHMRRDLSFGDSRTLSLICFALQLSRIHSCSLLEVISVKSPCSLCLCGWVCYDHLPQRHREHGGFTEKLTNLRCGNVYLPIGAANRDCPRETFVGCFWFAVVFA